MRIENFNLKHTVECGQVFRWKMENGFYYIVAKDNVVKIKQDGQALEFENVSEHFVKEFFRLGDNLDNIYSNVNKDKYIDGAINRYKGMRLIRQDPWECLLSYICSTRNSIPSINNILNALSKKYGEELEFDDKIFYLYPKPHDLAMLKESELKKSSLGYRAKYLLETSKLIDGGFDLYGLKNCSYENAIKKLMELSGVGPKVADCVCLFSLNFLEAFPVDTWVEKVMSRFYNIDKCVREEGRKYFGKYSGYAQEYLFHFARNDLCFE